MWGRQAAAAASAGAGALSRRPRTLPDASGTFSMSNALVPVSSAAVRDGVPFNCSKRPGGVGSEPMVHWGGAQNFAGGVRVGTGALGKDEEVEILPPAWTKTAANASDWRAASILGGGGSAPAVLPAMHGGHGGNLGVTWGKTGSAHPGPQEVAEVAKPRLTGERIMPKGALDNLYPAGNWVRESSWSPDLGPMAASGKARRWEAGPHAAKTPALPRMHVGRDDRTAHAQRRREQEDGAAVLREVSSGLPRTTGSSIRVKPPERIPMSQQPAGAHQQQQCKHDSKVCCSM